MTVNLFFAIWCAIMTGVDVYRKRYGWALLMFVCYLVNLVSYWKAE